MSREEAYRMSIYYALENIVVNYNGEPFQVPVYDSKLESEANIYVILASQTAIWNGNFVQKQWQCMIEIEIYHHQQDSATFKLVDEVSEIIENKILAATPMQSLILQPAEWQIMNTYLSSVNALKLRGYQSNAGTLINKTLQFTSQLLKL